MSRITEHIDVEVPRRVAYDQWTQFETFPQFMEGVERVVQLDDKTLDWTASVAGKTKHWRAEIMEQRPDQLISWRSIEGARNDGTVRFEPVDNGTTRLTLELDVEPDGPLESAGDALGFVSRRAKGDLERFKDFIESRGQAEAGWRGEVEGGRVEDTGSESSSSSIGSSSMAGGIGTTGGSYGQGSAGGLGSTSTYGQGSTGSDYGSTGSGGTLGGSSSSDPGHGSTSTTGSTGSDFGSTGPGTGGDYGTGTRSTGSTGTGTGATGSETTGDQ